MTHRNYFPLGKAYGEAFCNRVEETKWLVGNINSVKHSLLIAPRRYGKSSLAERAIIKSKHPFVHVNLHLCTTEEEVTNIIVNQVGKLIGRSIGKLEKIISEIEAYVSNLTPKLSFGGEAVTLELVPLQHENHAVVIVEALLLLDKLLKDRGTKAIIFFDEFQELTKIIDGSNIEGAIRTAAQEFQNLALIFSGSVRSLLLSMFEDEKKPLYKLCRKLKLERINKKDYLAHLNKVSEITWGEKLPKEILEKIIQLTNRHSYYLNYLCDIIWSNCNSLPEINDVVLAWKQVVAEEWGDAVRELSALAINQRKMLKFLSVNKVSSVTNQAVSSALKMPVGSINTATGALLEKDYIETNEDGVYQIIDPLINKILVDAQ